MKTKAQIRREIEIARACYAKGLERVAEAFGTDACILHEEKNKDLRIGFNRFLARYGERKRKGADFVPLPIEDLKSYIRAHHEFITDPHGRPEDLAPYINGCLGVTGSELGEAPMVDQLVDRLANLERLVATLVPKKRGPGRPKNPVPETE